MHIIKRNLTIYNEIFFIFLSFLYLHIIYSLDVDVSAFEIKQFITMIQINPILVAIGAIAMISIFTIRKFASSVLAIFSLSIFYKSFSVFLINYDKLHLLLNVVYLIISYNMILLLSEELKQAIYSPGYRKGSLNVEGYKVIEAKIVSKGKEYIGFVTNFDETGFVIKFETGDLPKGTVKYIINFDDIIFQGDAVVCIHYYNGIGIRAKLGKKEHALNDWINIYDILSKRGYN